MKKLKGLLLLFLFCGSCQAAFGFGLDGSLAEWGATPGAWGPGSDWVPLPGIHYAVEDYQPGTADGFVDPGFGGQTFDVEAMYATRDSENLYFAVVTGFPSLGFQGWSPSPIAIDFGSDGTYEYGIDFVAEEASNVGNLYKPESWTQGPYNNWGYGVVGYLAYPVDMVNPSLALNPAVANLVYNNLYYGATGHYVIEGFMPISAFDTDWRDVFTMHWTMGCGNDFIHLGVIPEPATLALFGLGLLGAVMRRRKLS